MKSYIYIYFMYVLDTHTFVRKDAHRTVDSGHPSLGRGIEFSKG